MQSETTVRNSSSGVFIRLGAVVSVLLLMIGGRATRNNKLSPGSQVTIHKMITFNQYQDQLSPISIWKLDDVVYEINSGLFFNGILAEEHFPVSGIRNRRQSGLPKLLAW